MCGIVGILSVRDEAVDEARLLRMRETLVHRGPDGAGLWINRSRNVGLGHRRLSIIDLSDAGLQPMTNDAGDLRLVYNGEIYNHVEIRKELESRGYRFRSRTDTEVVLHGYREWGEELLHRLTGMFAFGIWDERAGSLLLARDRIGIKPVYFTCVVGEFLFGSEIKSLLADPAVPRDVEPLAAWHYLSFLVPPAPLTMFRDVFKLPAGHLLRVRRGQSPEMERWWDPVDAPPPDVDPAIYADENACADELLKRLDASIERRMMSDVPFGVFLSGGVDSSTNVALMSRHMDRPVETFSVGFERYEEYNELEYARAVSDRFGTNHHEIVIDDRDMQAYLPELVVQQDEPIADWVCVPLHFVSKLARDSGVIVVQVGEGSDEQLCGYDHFRDPIRTYRHYARPLGALPRPVWRAAVRLARAIGRWDPVWARRAEIAERVESGEEIFWGGAVCYRGEEKESVWAGPRNGSRDFPSFVPRPFLRYDSGDVVKHLLDGFRAANPHADFYQQMLHLELRLRLPELLLMRVDKISMATSVEARVPFLDHHVVDFTMDLPLHFRLRGDVGKYLLKRAVRDLLPKEIIHRPKMGFGAPFREWLLGSFGAYARERLLSSDLGLFEPRRVRQMLDEHSSGAADRSIHLWVLLNLVLWHDHWIAGRSLRA
jgi:asparagine synthase (glutamine-hydrolysing)